MKLNIKNIVISKLSFNSLGNHFEENERYLCNIFSTPEIIERIFEISDLNGNMLSYFFEHDFNNHFYTISESRKIKLDNINASNL